MTVTATLPDGWNPGPSGHWGLSSGGTHLADERKGRDPGHPAGSNKPWGLFWETTGGSVLAGETSLQAAVREVREEVGLELDPAHGILIDSVRRDRDFLDSWFFQGRLRLYDLKLRPDEVVDAKFISREEYDHMRRGCMFVPTQPDFFQLYDVRLKNR